MKQQIEQLIGKLADKSLTFGCIVRYGESPQQILISPETEEYKCALYNRGASGLEPVSFTDEFYDFQVLGHPILIGDVLEKIDTRKAYISKDGLRASGYTLRIETLQLWADCGFTKSLQEIYAEAEWEWITYGAKAGRETTRIQVPKQPAIRELFQFLLDLKL